LNPTLDEFLERFVAPLRQSQKKEPNATLGSLSIITVVLISRDFLPWSSTSKQKVSFVKKK